MGSTDRYTEMLDKANDKTEIEYIIAQYERKTRRKAPAWMRAYLDKIE